MEKRLSIGIRSAIVVVAAISAHFTVMVHLYDMFTDCAQFEAALFSVSAVMLMAYVCLANLKAENNRTSAVTSLLILCAASAYWILGFCGYLKNGYRIMIDSCNSVRQLGRIAVLVSLILMPPGAACARLVFRGHIK